MPRDGRPGIALPLLERVERELALSGRSKTWLSRETGLARSTIDRLATIGRPDAATVIKIANALRIDRVEALTLAGLLSTDDDLTRQLIEAVGRVRELKAALAEQGRIEQAREILADGELAEREPGEN